MNPSDSLGVKSPLFVGPSDHEQVALVQRDAAMHRSSAGQDLHFLITYLDFALQGHVPILFGRLLFFQFNIFKENWLLSYLHEGPNLELAPLSLIIIDRPRYANTTPTHGTFRILVAGLPYYFEGTAMTDVVLAGSAPQDVVIVA